MSLHVLFFNEMEDYRKVLLHCFRVVGHFWSFYFFRIVWYVTATSSWIFTRNVEKCDFNYFETPCGFKVSILPEVIYCQTLYSSQGY